MSNTVVKEQKMKKEKKVKTPPIVIVEELEDMCPCPCPCPPKKPRKVSLQKSQPLVEVEEKKEEIIDTFIPAIIPVVEPPPVIVESPPVVFDAVLVIDKMEIFKKMTKELSKQKRDAKTAAMTPEQIEAHKQLARQKNKEFREKNKDKIREKDKKYSTANAEVIKAKRDAKLKDPVEKAKQNLKQKESKAKKRAEIKATAEPKPKKEARLTKVQKRDAILNNPDLTLEQKMEMMTALVK
jgi:hypothetical protein